MAEGRGCDVTCKRPIAVHRAEARKKIGVALTLLLNCSIVARVYNTVYVINASKNSYRKYFVFFKIRSAAKLRNFRDNENFPNYGIGEI